MAKLIMLAAPVWVDALQRSLMPIEGPQIVSDETAADWKAEGLLDGEPADVPDEMAGLAAAIVADEETTEKPARRTRKLTP